MKILQVVHSFLPDNFAGTEIYTYRLSKALQQRGHGVAVFFRENKPEKKEYELSPGVYDGIPTFALNNGFNQSSSFKDTYINKDIDQAFISVLDSFKPDVVHIEHLLFLSLGIIEESRKRNIPVVFTINDYWLFCPRGQFLTSGLKTCSGASHEFCASCIRPQLFIRKNIMRIYNLFRKYSPNWLLQAVKNVYFSVMSPIIRPKHGFPGLISERMSIVKEAISKINLFIAPSEFARGIFLKEGLPEEKICTYRYGIIKPILLPGKPREKETIRFGYVGTLLPMKGVNILVKAFRKLENRNARLLIHGKAKAYAGYESFYKDLCRQAGFDARISLMGEFDNSKIGEILSDIDVLVVPSIWTENAPLIIMEALASDIPVVASRAGGIPELVKDGGNGLLFEPGNAEELKSKLELFIQNPDLLARLKKNTGIIKNIEENAREIEGIYKQLCLVN